MAQAPEGSIFVGHLRDISDRRAAEAARAALEAQLRQAQKMEAVGQLTGGIAHDFNNILTSVIGYLVLGEERAEAIGDAALTRQLGQAHLAAQRARDLIAQMLAFARRQRGDRRVVDLAPLVRQTLRLLRATLPSSITLDGNAARSMPSRRQCAVAVRRGRSGAARAGAVQPVHQRARRDGRRRPHRGAAARPWATALAMRLVPGAGGRRPWVELSVADNGCGIAAELLERIFDPFFSTKAPGSGSGMGLAMVHGIVHDHGGHVRVQTEPGAGSVFCVMLPRAARDGPGAAAAAPHRPRPNRRCAAACCWSKTIRWWATTCSSGSAAGGSMCCCSANRWPPWPGSRMQPTGPT